MDYLRSVVAQSESVRHRLLGEVRTAMGGFPATDHTRSVGQHLLDAAYSAISENTLLRPDPAAFFEQPAHRDLLNRGDDTVPSCGAAITMSGWDGGSI